MFNKDVRVEEMWLRETEETEIEQLGSTVPFSPCRCLLLYWPLGPIASVLLVMISFQNLERRKITPTTNNGSHHYGRF